MTFRAVLPVLSLACLSACALVFAQGAKPPVKPLPIPPVEVSAKNAEAVIKKFCTMCHGPTGAMKAKFSTDWATMRSQKKIIPGKPEKSEVYLHLKSTTKPMPPMGVQPRPTAADIEAIRIWIARGAKKW